MKHVRKDLIKSLDKQNNQESHMMDCNIIRKPVRCSLLLNFHFLFNNMYVNTAVIAYEI